MGTKQEIVSYFPVTAIENFIHSPVFSVEISLQVLEQRWLNAIFICLMKSIESDKGQGY